MKVFAYNVETGVRGELLDEIESCEGYSSYGYKLPKVMIHKSEDSIQVVAHLTVKGGRKYVALDFGRNAVIMCTGKHTAGTDTYWEWVIIVTPL